MVVLFQAGDFAPQLMKNRLVSCWIQVQVQNSKFTMNKSLCFENKYNLNFFRNDPMKLDFPM